MANQAKTRPGGKALKHQPAFSLVMGGVEIPLKEVRLNPVFVTGIEPCITADTTCNQKPTQGDSAMKTMYAKNWEIYKDPTALQLEPITRMTPAAIKACKALHARKATKAEASRVAAEMRRQGRPCVVRKRVAK